MYDIKFVYQGVDIYGDPEKELLRKATQRMKEPCTDIYGRTYYPQFAEAFNLVMEEDPELVDRVNKARARKRDEMVKEHFDGIKDNIRNRL
jgi:hypothetical protein